MIFHSYLLNTNAQTLCKINVNDKTGRDQRDFRSWESVVEMFSEKIITNKEVYKTSKLAVEGQVKPTPEIKTLTEP